jgi:hypothetical protein
MFRKILGICSFLLFSQFALAADLQQIKNTYLENGRAIVDMVNAGNIDVAEVRKRVLTITENSVILAQVYIEKYPEGKALLEEAINNVAVLSNSKVTDLGPMQNESFQHMEDYWHDIGYTKEKDYGVDMEDEDNEHFTDPLHVMVHPIMVLRAAQDGNGDAMKSEMEEGMEQIELTVNAL